MTAPTLRPYQQAALAAIATTLEAGQTRVLVKKPTGTGKTVMFAAMLTWPPIATWLAQHPGRGARMLVIAHREELLTQAQAKIQAANPGLMVAIEQAEQRASAHADVVVASIQTLSARKFTRLQHLLRHHTFPVVVVDEAHHAAASTYRTALAHLGFLPMGCPDAEGNIEAATHNDVVQMEAALKGWDAVCPKDRLLVGVTATPNRTDAIGLGCVFQTIAYSYNLKEAIDDQWLVPIVPWVVSTMESLDDVRITHGEFNQKDLATTVNTERRNRLVVDAWKHYGGGRPTLAFTVDVQHAIDLAGLFAAAGVRAEAVHGETPRDERQDLLHRFLHQQVDVICNCMILTEGTDLPLTSCILHAKPTKSATLYEQMTGRGLRIHPGKTDCVVIDMVDIARKHSLQAAPVLYGLPPGLKTQGESLQKVADDLEALREQYPGLDIDAILAQQPYTLAELMARAKRFDPWSVPSLGDLSNAVSMNWIKVGDSYRLQYPFNEGTEVLTVQPDVLGHFDVVCLYKPKPVDGQPYWQYQSRVRQRTLANQVGTAREALKFAERFLTADREHQAIVRLKDRDAPWRNRPASPKQIAYLQKLRIPFNPQTVTMGEASDRIDLAKARRR